jgi:hypothetical protein
MSDVTVSVVESTTNVVVSEQAVAVDVTETVVDVSASSAGLQGASYNQGDPIYVTVRNATGSTLAKGTIVYISGSNGNHVQVTPAIATSDATSARTLGWLAEAIANNASGLCQVEGYLEGLNTQGLTSGTQLYLSGTVAGAFQVTKPQAPIHLVYVGVVTKISAGDGHVFVKVQNGYELDELHDVQIIGKADGDILEYDAPTDLWKNRTLTQANIARLAGGNSFTEAQIITNTSTTAIPLTLKAIASQTSDMFQLQNSGGAASFGVSSGWSIYTVGQGRFGGNSNLGAQLNVISTSTTNIGAVVRGASGQSADLLQLQNNSGTGLLNVSNTGSLRTSGAIAAGTLSSIGQFTVIPSSASTVGAVIRGAASQSANYFEIQDSAGSTAVRIASSGQLLAPSYTSGAFQVTSAGAMSVGTSSAVTTTQLLVSSTAATNLGVVIKGAASQSGDLLQVQDSASNIVASIGSSGAMNLAARLLITAQNSGSTGLFIRGANTSQLADLAVYQTSGATTMGGRNANAQIYSGSTAPLQTAVGSGVTATTGTGTTATITTQFNHNLSVGERITVAGVNPSGYNGTFIVTAVPSTTQLSYANATTAAWVSGGTVSVDNQASITLRSPGTTGLAIRANTYASGTLQSWQLADATEVTRVRAGGQIGIGSVITGTSFAVNTDLVGGASSVGAVIRGASGQTANLLEIQSNAGAILSRFESTGNLVLPGTTGALSSGTFILGSRNSGAELTMVRQSAATSNPGALLARMYFRDGTNAGTLRLVVRAGTAGAETTIFDNIPTT